MPRTAYGVLTGAAVGPGGPDAVGADAVGADGVGTGAVVPAAVAVAVAVGAAAVRAGAAGTVLVPGAGAATAHPDRRTTLPAAQIRFPRMRRV